MKEAITQSIQNLRANKLRSFLTMFGILWGMISVVVLSATGEGFRRGNDKVLRELGKNIGIVWGGRTSMQAGGERAGRQILLTLDDARAIAAESSMIAVVSPELERAAVKVKSSYNAATARVTGIEPQYQDIRTIELDYGRQLLLAGRDAGVARRDRRLRHGRAAVRQAQHPGRIDHAERHAVHGGRQDPQEEPGQQLQRSRQQQDLRPVRGDVARPAAPRRASPVRCRTSSSRRKTGSSTSCRGRSTSGPAGSRTSTGRSSRTSARFSRAATASIRTTSRRSRCGTPRCRP